MIAPILLLALAAAAPAPEPANPYAGLWTGWSRANSESVAAEARAADRARREGEAAATARQAAAQGRALGERVGEIVRLGDCAEGERVARAAGDFPLAAAVRAHCGLASPASH